MSQRKKQSPKRRAPQKVTERFEDCTVTVQGNNVWMSGRLADEIAEDA